MDIVRFIFPRNFAFLLDEAKAPHYAGNVVWLRVKVMSPLIIGIVSPFDFGRQVLSISGR